MENNERDYSQTGAITGGQPMVKIAAKKFCFEVPQLDGTTRDEKTFAGYLERVDMEFQAFNPEKPDLPSRWSVKLLVSASPSQGKIPGDEITYQIPLSSHWKNSMLGTIVNAIRGGLDSEIWKAKPRNRFLRIYLSEKAATQPGARPTCRALVFKSLAAGDWLDGQFPWDEDRKQHANVPQDLAEQTLFWLAVARQCVDLTGGAVSGADKATIRFVGLDAKPATSVPTQPAPTASGAITPYETALNKHLNTINATHAGDLDQMRAQYLGLYNQLTTGAKTAPSMHGLTNAWLQEKIRAFAEIHLNDPDIFVITAQGSPSGAVAPDGTEDLPF